MDRQALESKVIDCVSKTYRVDAAGLTPQTRLKDISDKSILLVALVSLIENEFGLIIALPEAAKLPLIGDFVDRLEREPR
ncbi:MAG: acyl carrier protein [Bifidobacteriaceae bacterium]|jgi:acyl carrier protein|nr:acyl carrier protein [Bifidobacteriaceae bacterium]